MDSYLVRNKKVTKNPRLCYQAGIGERNNVVGIYFSNIIFLVSTKEPD
jgi:hypothetical protein